MPVFYDLNSQVNGLKQESTDKSLVSDLPSTINVDHPCSALSQALALCMRDHMLKSRMTTNMGLEMNNSEVMVT